MFPNSSNPNTLSGKGIIVPCPSIKTKVVAPVLLTSDCPNCPASYLSRFGILSSKFCKAKKLFLLASSNDSCNPDLSKPSQLSNLAASIVVSFNINCK